MSNTLWVRQAASASFIQDRYLKDAASTVLDLFAAAKEGKDKHLEYLSNDAAVFIAAIWQSYLGSSRPQLWPPRDLSDSIIGITVMLHSAKQFIDGGIQMRKSKFRLVRRVKVAWDAPKIKAYRRQLAKYVLMAQAEILKLNLDNTQTAAAASMGYNLSAQLPEVNSNIEDERNFLRNESENNPRDEARMDPAPSSMRPTEEQFKRASDMGYTDQTHASDDRASGAARSPQGN